MSATESPANTNGIDSSKIEIKKYVNPPFSISANQHEKITPSNGSLIYENNLITVPGKNNVNVNLDLRYNSDEAAQYIPEFDTSTGTNCTGCLSYNYQNFALGCGWSFNLSYFETDAGIYYNQSNNYLPTAYTISSPEYLHLSDGRVLKLKRNSDTSYEFEDKSIVDLKFEVCDTVSKRQQYYNGQNFKVNKYIQGVWDSNATYKLIHKDGTIEYFNYDGKLLGVMDSNGNGYNVLYTVFKEGDSEHIYPCEITSTLGDEIKIMDIAPGGLAPSVIEYADQIITLNKTAIDGVSVLDNIERKNKNESDSKEPEVTKFEYSCYNGNFTYSSSYSPAGDNYGLLTKIIYPTGANSEYAYGCDNLNVGSSGYISRFRVEDQKLNDKSKEYKHYKYIYNQYRTDMVNQVNNDKTVYNYDDDNLLTSKEGYIKDKMVNKEDYTYNDKKLMTKSSRKVYNINGNDFITYDESMNYDERGNLIEHIDVMGNKSSYTYDPIYNQLLSKETPINAQIKQKVVYDRDKNGNVIKETTYHSDGNIEVDYKNNVSGEVIEVAINKKDGLKIKKSISYADISKGSYGHSPYRYDRSVKYITNSSISAYDPQTGAPTTIDKIQEQIGYNPKTGDIIEYKDANGNITKYEYDYKSRLVKQINPDNTSALIEYDDKNNTVTYTDETGYKVRNVYDGFGNLLRKESGEENAWKVETENVYDSLMRLSQVKDANGNTTSYAYDDLDRVIKIAYADGSNVQYIYDDVKNTKTTINEEGHSYTEYYDKLGRLIKKEANDGEKTITTINEYDYAGNLIKSTDANGNETKYVYDDLSRLIKVIDANGQETNYSYDELNQLVKISTNEYTRTKEYDQLGRVIKSCDESLNPSYFNYDGNGNLVWSKDKEGQIQTYNYNNLNRLNERYFGNEKTAYEYDAAGRIKTVKEYKDKQNPQYELTSYDYYADGKMLRENLNDGKSISYNYDPAGNITEMDDYFGNKVSYTYDQRNRTNTIDSNGKIFTYEYYKDGMIKDLQYPNPNLKAEYTYDLADRLKVTLPQ